MTSYRISVMDEHLQSNKDDPSGGDWEMVKWLYRLETNNYDWSISGPIISASGEETLSLLLNLEQLLWEQPWGRKMGRKRRGKVVSARPRCSQRSRAGETEPASIQPGSSADKGGT